MQLSKLCRLAIPTVLLLALDANAAVPVVYDSPADDGANPGGVPVVPALQQTTIHLYVDGGSVPSAQDPCYKGTGDEVCAWNLTFSGQGGLTAVSFTPSGNVVWNLVGDVLRCNRLDPVSGVLGPVKIGDLVVSGSEGGTLELTAGESVDSMLGVQAITPGTLVALPEPGVDVLGLAGFGLLLWLGRWRGRS